MSEHGMTTVSPVPAVDVHVRVHACEALLSFGGFRSKGEIDDQLNIDGSTPTFGNVNLTHCVKASFVQKY